MDLETKKQKLLDMQRRLQGKLHRLSEKEQLLVRHQRKERTRKLIQLGALVEKYASLEVDREFFIGCLMGMSKIVVDSESFLALKSAGEMELKKEL